MTSKGICPLFSGIGVRYAFPSYPILDTNQVDSTTIQISFKWSHSRLKFLVAESMDAGGFILSHYLDLFTIKRLWLTLAGSMFIMFSLLLYFGSEIYQQAPPIPEQVESESGAAIFNKAEIQLGQNIWQSLGGMQQGSIWGHGSYLAPDWSADWLHREALAWLEGLPSDRGSAWLLLLEAFRWCNRGSTRRKKQQKTTLR